MGVHLQKTLQKKGKRSQGQQKRGAGRKSKEMCWQAKQKNRGWCRQEEQKEVLVGRAEEEGVLMGSDATCLVL
jgi:hypothetical protein